MKLNEKYVLGVKINDVSLEEAVKVVENWLKGKGKHYIVTPNPEFMMAAQKDKVFMDILNNADLSIPDGVGLKLSGDIQSTTSGIDLMEALIKKAAEGGFTTGFLGGRDEVADKAAERLKKKYPKLKIVFAESGGQIRKDGSLPSSISIPTTDILFVAFGQVKQEKWIAKNLPHIAVKVVMGVGGAFDYLSGDVPRAPQWLRGLGLEWLFRLVIQPWRIKRQLVLIKFAWLITKNRLTKPG